MDTDALTPGLLQELRRTRPYPALSLTMPTHRTAPENAQDPVRLRNLVAEAGSRLDADPRVSRETAAAVKAQLDRAAEEVDQRRALDALVIFADADEYQIWQLPRTAPERVVLSDTYLTRNLVSAKARSRHFWVLGFSAEHATLFSGTNDGLRAEKRGGFPLTAPHEAPNPQREEQIGDTPSTYTSEDARNFLRTVDEKLRGVLAADPRPLFVVGLPPALSLLDEVGESARTAVGRIAKGTTADTSPPELLKELGPALEDWRQQAAAGIRGRLDNAKSRRSFAGGLDEVWTAVQEGRAGLVTAEEHFEQKVRVTDGHLEPVGPDVTPGTDGQVREDVVDEIVEAALDNGCEVAFVADDSLAGHGRVAAVLRF
ncbi:chemotaxis protein [Streptomyces sp. NPDC086010]|uniref:baeRF3 domain-containing protein n=1 Tax=Streptomyces sp. NPDC086010 TaxID=3365745 RepID=UPI0037D983D3